MRTTACVIAVSCLMLAMPAAQAPSRPVWLDPHRDTVSKLIAAALADDFAWRRLAELTDTFGARLSGSDNLERAITWSAETMRRDGFDVVRTEPVMVPKWVRGREHAEIVNPPRHELAILGLGGTVPTPAEGIESDVAVVQSFEELRRRGNAGDLKGRIVLYNARFINYTETVTYRTEGARRAAQFGAAAVLVRSVGPTGLRTPHTGSVTYGDADVSPIPAAAVAAEDADRIQRMVARGDRVRIRLTLESQYEGETQSYNVVAEITGRELPHEIVLIGAHLDSWDVGAGASDDGVGCVATWEAARLMVRAGLRPRRTVRVVLFTNEENGLAGANAYLTRYRPQAADHVFALEMDSGAFEPALLGFTGTPAARATVGEIATLLTPLELADVVQGGGGADIGPIVEAGRVPAMAYLGNPARYFAIHHTAADTIERITPQEVSKAVAAIAAMTYVIAEMPERLPR